MPRLVLKKTSLHVTWVRMSVSFTLCIVFLQQEYAEPSPSQEGDCD